MSNISQAQKNLKKKLSLDDYSPARETYEKVQAQVAVDKPAVQSSLVPASQVTNPKIKATYYLSEEDHGALTQVYIMRLQSKKKTDRSALISEAIRLLFEKEMK